MATAPTCPYCGKPAKLVTGQDVYPHRKDLYDKLFYRCKPCDARTSANPETSEPEGTMANAALRKARQAAHAAFDPLYGPGRDWDKGQAYAWLSETLGIPPERCHMRFLDEATCVRVIEVAREENRRVRESFEKSIDLL